MHIHVSQGFSTTQSLETLPKQNEAALISESFALNFFIRTPLTNI